MRADRLPENVTGPAVICAQAGEVNTGAFDQFPKIMAWAPARCLGACGWRVRSLGAGRPLASASDRSLADADSWAADAHKWLNVPYDCGVCLVRRPGALRRSSATVAGYRPPDTGFETSHHTPQASQRARQVEVWAVLRTLGCQGVPILWHGRATTPRPWWPSCGRQDWKC